MFDLGFGELLLIGIVALIVIGPKDLPGMFRTLGRFTAKARAMSRDLSRAMEQAAKETGVADVAKDLKTATSARSMGLDAVSKAADKFEKWDPIKNEARPTTPAPARTALPAVTTITTPGTAAPVAKVLPEEPTLAAAPVVEAEPVAAPAAAPARSRARKKAEAPPVPVEAAAAEVEKKPRARRKPAPKGDAA
jgi:sec-independent protein translocase protein TatB